MNKPELAAVVAEQLGLTKKETERILTCAFESISAALADGEKVQIAGFGAFETKERGPHIGRNPKTGELVEVPATRAAVFKAGKKLKEKVAD